MEAAERKRIGESAMKIFRALSKNSRTEYAA
jgi:hypothetical protein